MTSVSDLHVAALIASPLALKLQAAFMPWALLLVNESGFGSVYAVQIGDCVLQWTADSRLHMSHSHRLT